MLLHSKICLQVLGHTHESADGKPGLGHRTHPPGSRQRGIRCRYVHHERWTVGNRIQNQDERLAKRPQPERLSPERHQDRPISQPELRGAMDETASVPRRCGPSMARGRQLRPVSKVAASRCGLPPSTATTGRCRATGGPADPIGGNRGFQDGRANAGLIELSEKPE